MQILSEFEITRILWLNTDMGIYSYYVLAVKLRCDYDDDDCAMAGYATLLQ